MRIRTTFSITITAVALVACSEADMAAPEVDDGAQFDLVLVSSGPPFYTIAANGGFVPHTNTWAALPFLRPLTCVPPTANLLLIDFSAFGCPVKVVEGHEHWDNGPGVDAAPRQTVFRGLGAVPVVFAPWDNVRNAMADGVLTLNELLQLPQVRIGSAHTYHETDILGVSGPLGAGRGMYKISARGTLSGGGTFRLHVNEVLGEQHVVEIELHN